MEEGQKHKKAATIDKMTTKPKWRLSYLLNLSSICEECRGLSMLADGREGVVPTGAMNVVTFNPHSTAKRTHRLF